MRQPMQKFVAPIMVNHSLGDNSRPKEAMRSASQGGTRPL